MKVLDLFSGIGGFSLGLEAAGMTTVAFCERESFCQAVLKKHWPDIPCHGDVTTLNGKQYNGTVDVIAGGFPCQDISLAGKGAGLAGERSGLWFEYLRIIKEAQPRYVIIENVSALRSRGLEAVLGTLAEIGYDAEWHCIPASAVGAPHQRDRVWIVAYPQSKRYTCGKPANEAGQERAIKSGRQAQGVRFAEPSDKGGISDVAHANNAGLQGWIGTELQERSSKRSIGSGCALADTYSEPPQWIAEPRMQCDPWIIEPAVGRVVDGLSGRVDRIKSLGNSIVPQIAQIIGQAIIERENTMNNCCSKCGEEEISPNIEAFEISGDLVCDECAEEIFEANSQFGVGS